MINRTVDKDALEHPYKLEGKKGDTPYLLPWRW
jgi:hypothetical protein